MCVCVCVCVCVRACMRAEFTRAASIVDKSTKCNTESNCNFLFLLQICIEQMRSDGPAISDHCANTDQSWKTFSYDTLPEKYWKKYSYACR